MAYYFLHVKVFSRGKGSKSTKAAAYRAGVRIRDGRTSAVFDYSARTDVAHAEIVLPTEYSSRVEMEWAMDRATLWNAAEHAGRQWNSRLAREVLVHLPAELTPSQRRDLVRGFSRELADRYRNAVDFAIHEPRAWADHRNHHAHLLMTTREVGPSGLSARTTLDLSGSERHARGLGNSKEDLLWIRERWAVVTNDALHQAGVSARIDHRSYKDQGIDREPQARIPLHVMQSERLSGKTSPAGDDIRARRRERVEARQKGGEELARVVARQKEENRQRAIEKTKRKELEKKTPQGALTREQINQRRREWRKANAEAVNAKLREYRKRHAEQDSARRWVKLKQRQAAKIQPGKSLETPGQDPVPDPSMVNPNADDAVNNWLAYRESQRSGKSLSGAAHEPSAQSFGGTEGADTKEPSKDSGRGRKNDAAL